MIERCKQFVISSEARNLNIMDNYRIKIPRLSPRNDITKMPREQMYDLWLDFDSSRLAAG